MSIYQNTKTHLHHIVPRRKGGTDDPSNLVELTIYDHAIAHRHLWKMYGDDGDRKAYYYLLATADRGDEHYVKMSQKVSEANKKRYSKPEERKKASEHNIKRWLNPEFRRKMIETNKKRYSDPEERKRTSEATKRGIAAAKARRAAAPQVP